MTRDVWGAGSDAHRGAGADAHRAARPVVVCLALGVAAFALTFSAALLLGRGLSGSALAALLVPLALSGAMAVGLVVAFGVALALEQPYSALRVRRLVPVVTPLAALVALFAYAADPAGTIRHPFAGAAPPPGIVVAPPVAVPPRVVTVPPATPPRAQPAEVLGTRTRRVVTVAGPVAPLPRVRPRALPRDPDVVAGGGKQPHVVHVTKWKNTCAKAAKRGRAHCHSKRGRAHCHSKRWRTS